MTPLARSVLAVGFVAIAGCGHGSSIRSGMVVDKKFTAAHTDTYTYFICAGYMNNVCISQIPLTGEDHYPDGWSLKLQQCQTKSDGQTACRHGWTAVPKATFDATEIGSHWGAA